MCVAGVSANQLLALGPKPMMNSWDVRDFGARGDGLTLDTRAVQTAIDSCNAAGGGFVHFPTGGAFLIGTIYLKSHVTLYVDSGASIIGSMDRLQYGKDTGLSPYYPEELDRCLIYAKGATNIGLAGSGTIVGKKSDQYVQVPGATGRDAEQRPMLIRLEDCTQITISDLTMERCGSWCIHLKNSKDIFLRNLRINNERQDGFDIDGCENTTISDCHLVCGDDCIAVMTGSPERPVRNLNISNCMMRSLCSGLRFGPLSKGNMEDITVSNCVIYDCDLGGIKLGMFEGAEIRNCVFDNIVMDRVTAPISMFVLTWPDIGSTDAHPRMMPVGKIHHLQFRGIRAVTKPGPPDPRPDQNSSMFFHGHPASAIEDILLTDIDVTIAGGGTAQQAQRRDMIDADGIDYREDGGVWTDHKDSWGIPPGYGLYARHMKRLVLNNVSLSLAQADARSPLFFLDSQDVSITQLQAECAPETAVVTARNCSSLTLARTEPRTKTTLLRLEGENSSSVELVDNDSRRYSSLFECADGASASVVKSN